MWTVSVLVIFQVDEADVSFFFFFSLASSCRFFFPVCRFWQNERESYQKLKDDLILFQRFAGFWFAIPSCLISQDYLIFFFLFPVCKWQFVDLKNCVDGFQGYADAFFLHGLKTICMCSVCGIGDIILWDVKHCDVSQLYCNLCWHTPHCICLRGTVWVFLKPTVGPANIIYVFM